MEIILNHTVLQAPNWDQDRISDFLRQFHNSILELVITYLPIVAQVKGANFLT